VKKKPLKSKNRPKKAKIDTLREQSDEMNQLEIEKTLISPNNGKTKKTPHKSNRVYAITGKLNLKKKECA